MEAGAWWDFRRSAIAVRAMTEAAAEHGVDHRDVSAGSGAAASDPADPAVEIDAHQELAVVRHVLGALGDRPSIAADVGSRFTLGDYRQLRFALLSSPTLRAALDGEPASR
ncbi:MULTISPECIES: AraC family transcriptional regulator ligand-binding domain-containing protein [unclassified Amycolatopsis]|uniref:AraC family transcriptional regulator ligand-binding domain-containing protein n=1 Tax=unclassified Amycolatopsis TaxID=2618356 RepID=UPI001EE8A00A|nr:AraC family transcriptional regulator ligand-binding domain-containing protein [Amycolatopsis sp. Poz14]MCG3753134.1 AraC family transcriptional regulator ligand-binding domain-containing protein [Amycolatopsis sp. Poz14]